MYRERHDSLLCEGRLLRTDAVYGSEAFNDLLPMYGITHSMSRTGTPTDNAAMEAINGWSKAELFADFHVTGERPVETEVDEYIDFFNEQRPAGFAGMPSNKAERMQREIVCLQQQMAFLKKDMKLHENPEKWPWILLVLDLKRFARH